MSADVNSCTNCGCDTENEPLVLCDDCNDDPVISPTGLNDRIAELEAALAKAVKAWTAMQVDRFGEPETTTFQTPAYENMRDAMQAAAREVSK